jgi:hypothetical protein
MYTEVRITSDAYDFTTNMAVEARCMQRFLSPPKQK